MIIVGERTIFSEDGAVGGEDGAIIVDACQHGLDRLNCIFLVDNLNLEFSPIFNVLLVDIVQDDLLLDGINDLPELLDRVFIASQVGKISCLA